MVHSATFVSRCKLEEHSRDSLTTVPSSQTRERRFLGNVSLPAILLAHQSPFPSELSKGFVFQPRVFTHLVFVTCWLVLKEADAEAERDKLVKF